jgi:hypothetical protein
MRNGTWSTRWLMLVTIAVLALSSPATLHAAEIFTDVLVETSDGGRASSNTGLSQIVGAHSLARSDASVAGTFGNVRVQVSTERLGPPISPDGGAVQARATFVETWTSAAAVGAGTGAPLGVKPVLNVHGVIGNLPGGELRIEYTVLGQIFDTRPSPPVAFITVTLLDVRLTAFEGSTDLEGQVCDDSGCTPVTIPGPSFSASIPLPSVSIGPTLAAADSTYGPLGISVSGGMLEIATVRAELDPSVGDSGFIDFFNTLTLGLQAPTAGGESVWVSSTGHTLVPAESADHTAPTTVATRAPGPNAAGWNNTNVQVAFTAQDEDGGSGVKEIHADFNGGASGFIFPGASTSAVITAEGTTTVSYFAVDNAGNQETAKTLTVRIDKTPPAVTCVPVARRGHGDDDEGERKGLFMVSASDARSGVARLTLGGVSLAQGEVIRIKSTKRSGIRLVADDDDDEDGDDPRFRYFKVGPGEAVVRATDVAGNAGSAVCPLRAR